MRRPVETILLPVADANADKDMTTEIAYHKVSLSVGSRCSTDGVYMFITD